jgi:thymidylate kinase
MMANGKLIVIEGIYGSGKIIVNLVERLRASLIKLGKEVYEIDSPDSGRAQIMGAQELDNGWRYGMFKPDFFFELASRARVTSVTRDELRNGKIVICKHFTVSSIVHARLKGHDWYREDLNCLEDRARGVKFGGEVVPDLTIFIDVSPETAAQNLESNESTDVKTSDLILQQKYYKEEFSKMPENKYKIIDGMRHEDDVFNETLSIIKEIAVK